MKIKIDVISNQAKIVAIPSFIRKIKRIKDKKQKEMIKDCVKKLEDRGIKAVKILYQKKNYILGEIKKSSYRLYVIYDKGENIFFIVEWEHKNRQEEVIRKLQEKLKEAFRYGIGDLHDVFFK